MTHATSYLGWVLTCVSRKYLYLVGYNLTSNGSSHLYMAIFRERVFEFFLKFLDDVEIFDRVCKYSLSFRFIYLNI